MTDYAALPTSQIDADSPLIEDTMIKLRDNPLAMFEGAAGAPRLQSIAISGPVAGSITMAKVYRTYSGSQAWTKVGEYSVSRSGTIRTRIALTSASSRNAHGRIYLNGVAYGTQRTVSNGSQSWDEDLAFSSGDILQMYAMVDGPDLGGGTTHEFKLLVGNPIDHVYEVL